MALDERFLIAGPLNQYFVDKITSLPLSGGKLFFFRDSSRTTPKTVYQLTGTPPNYTYAALPNPITLSSAGTILNASNDQVVPYFLPFDDDDEIDLYYIVCEDSVGNEQWTREGWPNLTPGNDPTDLPFSSVNQMSNHQFSRTFIPEGQTETLTVNTSDVVFPVAPDWEIIASGTGTIMIKQVPVAGNDKVVTSPPYVLDIEISSGITDAKLRQKMNVNSGLWASTPEQDIFLSGKVLARNQDVGSTGITLFYEESSGGSPIQIVNDTFDNTVYSLLTGTTDNAIPLSTNIDQGDDGFIYIYAQLSGGTHIRLSSFQVVPTATIDDVAFDNIPSNRAQANMGDYFIPRLESKRISSILIGWDFLFNPNQLVPLVGSQSITSAPAYLWDQTIAFRTDSDVSVARSALTGGIEFTTTADNNAFYIMQYLDAPQINEILGSRLSVNVNGFKSDVGSPVTMRVYLFRGNSTAIFPVLPADLGNLNTDGTFSLTEADWSSFARSNLDAAETTLTVVTDNSDINKNVDYGFNGWELIDDAEIGDTDKFAILVTFSCPTTDTVVTIDSISLTPGDIPTRPSVESFDSVLRKCQYYYEKSWESDVPLFTSTRVASRLFNVPILALFNGSNHTYYLNYPAFTLEFKTNKRLSNPIISFFSPQGNLSNTIERYIVFNGAAQLLSTIVFNSVFNNISESKKRSTYEVIDTVAPIFMGSTGVPSGDMGVWLEYHYTIDARIGII